MNNPRFKVSLATALAVVFGLPTMGFAWWGFVHYRIAKDIAGVNPDFAMGPDTFPAASLFGVVTTDFSWSHAVMASDFDFPPPDIPQYPHDGRYPGKVMMTWSRRNCAQRQWLRWKDRMRMNKV